MTNPTIYRKLLLKHARHPKNSGRLKEPDLRATAYNPLCGDELELTLSMTGTVIEACKTQVRGCAICQASASMMSELIIKKTMTEVVQISSQFADSLQKETNDIPQDVECLRPLIALKAHRSRIKCMKLAWEALEDCAAQNQT
ncbi:MAG: SUF system NifU family Fe-S cluster assembly protein [SAR324 cluster bacterium]|nr:SUF system NifU family Fe-S cluster assembly protein [SAR324 cluster bacterium]MBL7035043.1 SUF system NifU family Fe-S cluster assembly protein [SAR324 cluster bacterium]